MKKIRVVAGRRNFFDKTSGGTHHRMISILPSAGPLAGLARRTLSLTCSDYSLAPGPPGSPAGLTDARIWQRGHLSASFPLAGLLTVQSARDAAFHPPGHRACQPNDRVSGNLPGHSIYSVDSRLSNGFKKIQLLQTYLRGPTGHRQSTAAPRVR